MEPVFELAVDVLWRPERHSVVDPVWSDARPAEDAGVVDCVIGDEAESEIGAPNGQPAKVVRTDKVDRTLNGVEPNGAESTQRRDQAAVDAVHPRVLAAEVRLDGPHLARVPLFALGEHAAATWALPQGAGGFDSRHALAEDESAETSGTRAERGRTIQGYVSSSR